MESNGKPPARGICTCPGDSCELVKKRSDFLISNASSEKRAFDDALQKIPTYEAKRDFNFDSPSAAVDPDAPATQIYEEPISGVEQSLETPNVPNSDDFSKLNQSVEQPKSLVADGSDFTKFNASHTEAKNIDEARDKERESVDTIIEEPKYEDVKESKSTSDTTSKIKSCECEVKVVKSQCTVMAAKSKTKQSSTKTNNNRKEAAVKFVKEKKQKFTQLKETVTAIQQHLSETVPITQQYLTGIQEQIRQLERLFEDYETLATPQGQVNPARLYREIMKPQTVPYVSFARPPVGPPVSQMSMQVSQTSQRPLPICTCQSKRPIGKVSVLSAVALEDDSLYF